MSETDQLQTRLDRVSAELAFATGRIEWLEGLVREAQETLRVIKGKEQDKDQ